MREVPIDSLAHLMPAEIYKGKILNAPLILHIYKISPCFFKKKIVRSKHVLLNMFFLLKYLF